MTEPCTKTYKFTESQMLKELGDGATLTKEDLVEIDLDDNGPEVSTLIIELMSASPQPHWYAHIDIPDDPNEKLFATIKMSPVMWDFCKACITKYLPNSRQPWNNPAKEH